MRYERNIAMRKVKITDQKWTDLQGKRILPFACTNVFLINKSQTVISFRTDPSNEDSEIELDPGEQLQLGSGPRSGFHGERFQSEGCAIGSVKSAAGEQVLHVLSVI